MFAMAELAIVSARKARLQQMAEDGSLGARTALRLASHPNEFLAAVQVGITLVGILAGAFGGGSIADRLAAGLSLIPGLGDHAQGIAIVLVVVVITYLSLIIGELVPKRVALSNPERIAVVMAGPMLGLAKLASPLVWLLDRSANALLRVLGVERVQEPAVTPEEIQALVEQGAASGVFDETAQEMIEGVLDVNDKTVETLMTPRAQMVAFDIADGPAAILDKLRQSGHSRYPVVQDVVDNVLGFVTAKELLAQQLSGKDLNLHDILRPAVVVPETMTALKALEMFKQHSVHIMLVTDEYGGIQGLITHNDILEAIVGDLATTEEDDDEYRAIRREDGSWLIDGLMPIDRFKDTLGIEELPNEEDEEYQTAAGFVIKQLDSLPTVGQHFTWNGVRVEVVDMDGRRVDKILVSRLAEGDRDRETVVET